MIAQFLMFNKKVVSYCPLCQYLLLYTYVPMWYPDYLIMVWFPHNIPLYSHKIIILSHKKVRKSDHTRAIFPFYRPHGRNAWKENAWIQVHPPWRPRWSNTWYLHLIQDVCIYIVINIAWYVFDCCVSAVYMVYI